MKSSSYIFKKISRWTKRIIWFAGFHAFALILFLVLADVIFGGFIFYEYVLLANKEQPQVTEDILKFDYNGYQNVLNDFQAKEQPAAAPLTSANQN